MTRGLRNNNPGNLRHGSDWIGLCEEQTDPDFCQFIHPIYGIRALVKTLLTYNTKYGLDTVQGIISRYAPTSENNTKTYVRHVAHKLAVDPDEPIEFDWLTMLALVKVIIKHENGEMPYDHETLSAGILLGGIAHP